jgi:hypothetical protein
MDRSYPSALRIKQRLQFRQRLAAGAVTAIAACAFAFAMGPDPAPAVAAPAGTPSAAPVAQPAADATPAARRVYRYSVVPGGALDRAELAHVIAGDKLVAAHYADFKVDAARPVTVATPRAVYVSYRKDGQIYWTAKKVMLQAGETLLTDGSNGMRARCANRISDVPRFPVEKRPPPVETLDRFGGGPDDEGEGSSINFVSGPELEGFDDLPPLGGEPAQPVWPAEVPPNPSGTPEPVRSPPPLERPPGFPWPPTGWNDLPGLPAPSGRTPPPVLTYASPPPLSRAIPELPEAGTPPSEPGPFVPPPEPGQPTPPNPALDLPPPADVPEPATPWLVAVAALAMLGLRKKR